MSLKHIHLPGDTHTLCGRTGVPYRLMVGLEPTGKYQLVAAASLYCATCWGKYQTLREESLPKLSVGKIVEVPTTEEGQFISSLYATHGDLKALSVSHDIAIESLAEQIKSLDTEAWVLKERIRHRPIKGVVDHSFAIHSKRIETNQCELKNLKNEFEHFRKVATKEWIASKGFRTQEDNFLTEKLIFFFLRRARSFSFFCTLAALSGSLFHYAMYGGWTDTTMTLATFGFGLAQVHFYLFVRDAWRRREEVALRAAGELACILDQTAETVVKVAALTAEAQKEK